MSAIINTGGPAFPCGRDVTLDMWEPEIGMTLRDYFAAHASDGDIESIIFGMTFVDVNVRKALPHESRQIARYMHADLMIKARAA